MSTFQLSINTPEGQIFDQQVDSLVAPGEEGSFGILAKHAPFIAATKKGILRAQKEGRPIYFAVTPSILEVHKGGVIVFAGRAVLCTSLNAATQQIQNII